MTRSIDVYEAMSYAKPQTINKAITQQKGIELK